MNDFMNFKMYMWHFGKKRPETNGSLMHLCNYYEKKIQLSSYDCMLTELAARVATCYCYKHCELLNR